MSIEEASDAIGEIANMIAGNAKRDLNKHLAHLFRPGSLSAKKSWAMSAS